MTPIAALEEQRRLVEVGRIRLGEKSQKGAPVKLKEFRLTSASRELLEQAAEIYGGTVEGWSDPAVGAQFQLQTTARELDVLLVPGPTACSQWFEMWSGGGIQRRCDGRLEVVSDGPCQCPADPEERAELAGKGKACKPTTRLSLILPRVGGLGVWRLESHGWNAAVEIPATVQLAQALAPGMLVPATLAAVERTKRRAGTTSRFVVPELRLNTSVSRIAAGEHAGLALGAPAASGSDGLPALPAAPIAQADPLEERRTAARETLSSFSAKDKKALLEQAGIRSLQHATDGQLDQLEMLIQPIAATSAVPVDEDGWAIDKPVASPAAAAPNDDEIVPLQDPDRQAFLRSLASWKTREEDRQAYLRMLASDTDVDEWKTLTRGQLRVWAERLQADSWRHNRLSRFRSECAARQIVSNEFAATHGISDVSRASIDELERLLELVSKGVPAS